MPKLKPFNLQGDKGNVLKTADGRVIKCYVCGYPLKDQMALAIGPKLVHRHIKMCEAFVYATERFRQQMGEERLASHKD